MSSLTLKRVVSLRNDKRQVLPEDRVITLENVEGWTGKLHGYTDPANVSGELVSYKKDDVLFNKLRPYLAKVHLASHDGLATSEMLVLKPDADKLLPKYLFYKMASRDTITEVNNATYGVKMPRANWDIVGSLAVGGLPKIQEQQQVITLLDNKTQVLDKMITAKNHTHTHLSELRQAIIDTSILEVGMSNLLALKRVATMINRGASPDYADDGKAKFINQACIYREDIKLSAAKSANELSHMAGSRGYLHEYDLLVNSTGTGTLGRVAIFDQDNDGTYFADSHVTIVRPDCKKIDPQYLRYVMISTKFQDEVYTMCVSGSTNQIELSRERFRELQIPVPSLEKQREIVRQLEERIRNVDAADVTLRRSISQLEEYRSSLISNVVGGKVEV